MTQRGFAWLIILRTIGVLGFLSTAILLATEHEVPLTFIVITGWALGMQPLAGLEVKRQAQNGQAPK